jgi:nucleoside phosphorylase
VDSAGFKGYLTRIVPGAIGGEMESAGVFSAADRAKVEAIVVKGICDWGENKDKLVQEPAAENAFEFALRVLQKL